VANDLAELEISYVTYRPCHITFGQPEPIIVLCATNTQYSHPLSGAVAYRNRLDRTTATLRLQAPAALYGYRLCPVNTHAGNFTAGVVNSNHIDS